MRRRAPEVAYLAAGREFVDPADGTLRAEQSAQADFAWLLLRFQSPGRNFVQMHTSGRRTD
jgi:hypothetical protein